MIAVVVVDVDDTLYLERDYVRSGLIAVSDWCLREFGVAGVADRAWSLFLSGRRRTTISDALTELGMTPTPTEVGELIRVYREHDPTIRMLPDASLFLDQIADLCRLAVITDGPASSQRAKCRALGLDRRSDLIVISEEHGSSKPDPALFKMVEQHFGTSTDSLIYIADNPAKDFQGPLERGWRSVRIRRPLSLHFGAGTPAFISELPSMYSLFDDLRTSWIDR